MISATVESVLSELGISKESAGAFDGSFRATGEDVFDSLSPIDGSLLGKVRSASEADWERIIEKSQDAFVAFRKVPAPIRGEVVRRLGNELRKHKEALGVLVTLEMGKIKSEGLGEVQEMIDICDFAVGLSRQLYGLNMPSERPDHRIMEQWHPLGTVGVITAFNFPVAVWAWNAALALVCGDPVIFKPSPKTPLCAVACMILADRVMREMGMPEGVVSMAVDSGNLMGEKLAADPRVRVVSATGSTRMGKAVGSIVGGRLGKLILELGGNNALIVSNKMTRTSTKKGAIANALFGAVGTAGQRCTSTRRVIIHEDLYDSFVSQLVDKYSTIRIGNPLEETTLMGPLIDEDSADRYHQSLAAAADQGAKVLCGGGVWDGAPDGCKNYVVPAIVEAKNELPIVQQETFGPVVYVMKYSTLPEAISIHNDVPQGLSSSLFSDDQGEASFFLSAAGSDCGIANINVGTSGAEIGGAFGGEKDTGGGRESGSDAWKAYMRRQTNTLSWSEEVHLAQGVDFDV